MLIYVPSLTETDNRGQEKAASFDKALACAYIRLENERRKGRRILFKQQGEVISFLAQILWPFVLINKTPKKVVVFDAVGRMKRLFIDGEVTKSTEFSSQLEKCIPSVISRQDFHKSLETFATYFKNFDHKTPYEIIGCFSETEKAKDIINALRLGGSLEINESICLPIVIDAEKAKAATVVLTELREKLETDIEMLTEMVQPLDSILSKWHKQISDEIEKKRLPFDRKIKEITPEVNERIKITSQEKREELTPLELELRVLESEVRQLQDAYTRAKLEESRADDDAMDAAGDIDQANEDIQEAEQELEIERRQEYDNENINLRISHLQTRISNAESRLYRAEDRYRRASERQYECERATREASERLDDAKDALQEKQDKYDDIKDSWDNLIAEQRHRISNLEEKRDKLIADLNQEDNDLIKKSEIVRKDIERLVSRKWVLISEIDSNYIHFSSASPHKESGTYVYVPFFLATLSARAKKALSKL